jgi:hypothetical protein
VTDLGTLMSLRSIVVCCGTGGVGKTTTAATVALEGARQGRRTVAVTIDPAKRLADALGALAAVQHAEPYRLRLAGELWVVMLDTKTTFDQLVLRQLHDPQPGQPTSLPTASTATSPSALSGAYAGAARPEVTQRATTTPLRPRRRRHPADARTPSLPRLRGRLTPVSSTTACTAWLMNPTRAR